MIEETAERLAKQIVSYNNQEKDREIYIYGLQIILNTAISIGVVLLFGFIFGEFLNTVTFLVCYCSVRVFAGGLHASTNNRCMTIFISGYLLAYLYLENRILVLNGYVLCLLIAINICVICFAPVEAKNNPIPIEKMKKMKKRSIIISVSITFLVSVLLFFKYEAGRWGVLGLCWIAIILIIGKLKNMSLLREV